MQALAKLKDVTDETSAVASALQPSAGFAFQVFKVAMGDSFFVKDASFTEMEDLRELETGSTLYRTRNLVHSHSLCKTRSGHGRVISLDVVPVRKDIKEAVGTKSSEVVSGAHGLIFVSA